MDHKIYFYFITVCLFQPYFSAAQNPEDERAHQIFEEVNRRQEMITYETSDMQMIISDSGGRTRNRDIRSYSFNEGDINNSLLIFESPANIRGTGFLTLSEGSEEEQKLYLPALGQIKVISASEKGDRFMGSDFTYEDLGDRDADEYRFEMLAETDTSYVLSGIKIEESQYDRLNFYIDPERYIVRRIEYFNSEGAMIKRLEANNYEQVMDNVWQAGYMVMYDLQNNRRTELRWSNRAFGESIPDWRFTERGLRRGVN